MQPKLDAERDDYRDKYTYRRRGIHEAAQNEEQDYAEQNIAAFCHAETEHQLMHEIVDAEVCHQITECRSARYAEQRSCCALRSLDKDRYQILGSERLFYEERDKQAVHHGDYRALGRGAGAGKDSTYDNDRHEQHQKAALELMEEVSECLLLLAREIVLDRIVIRHCHHRCGKQYPGDYPGDEQRLNARARRRRVDYHYEARRDYLPKHGGARGYSHREGFAVSFLLHCRDQYRSHAGCVGDRRPGYAAEQKADKNIDMRKSAAQVPDDRGGQVDQLIRELA